MRKIYLILLAATIIPEAFARPEYALQLRSNRCTTCHANPTGGGHRNLTGKAFGPKSAPLESFSKQDVFGFDFRAVFYTPTQAKDLKSSKSGMGVMAALPSISVPFNKKDDKEWRLVYSHSIGGFFTAQARGDAYRDAYLRIQLYEDYRLYPQYILVGRFPAPFGLLDDEHRTYIRQQTKTAWNNQKIGLLFSGDWTYRVHYDLALVNGESNGTTLPSNNQPFLWGGIANLRFLFSNLGWMVGTSASIYNNEMKSGALSVYQNLSLNNLTKNFLPGNLMAEAVLAKQMNSYLPSTFISDSSYLTKEVINRNSLGVKAQWNYDFLPAWKFIFKYDYLRLDISNRADFLQRYGLGLRYFFNNQTSAQIRYEKALIDSESKLSKGTGLANMDVIWALLQVKI